MQAAMRPCVAIGVAAVTAGTVMGGTLVARGGLTSPSSVQSLTCARLDPTRQVPQVDHIVRDRLDWTSGRPDSDIERR
jgi:hypothetical protein